MIEQSESQFIALRGETGSDYGDYEATFALPDAGYCVIIEDAEKSSYKCTWEYAHGDEQARETFQRFASEMRSCIGDLADEQTDQPVNHPDFYAAHYYQLAAGEVRVSLKNKSKLGKTLVSIVIDGFAESN